MLSTLAHTVRRTAAPAVRRSLHTTAAKQAKVVVALYPDPETGYPPKYARDSIPKIEKYPDGQTAPTPAGIDFTPGELLGCVSGELGLREYLESNGHTLVVTSDKYVPQADSLGRIAFARAARVVAAVFGEAMCVGVLAVLWCTFLTPWHDSHSSGMARAASWSVS